MKKLVTLGASLLLSATISFADSTPEQAKALVEEGVAFCKEVGVAKCVEEFNKRE